MNEKLITIVTVVRNAADCIEKTLRSVRALKTPEVEYVVLDGASTDGTTDILKRYEDVIDYLRSEPDGGIYDAMNKAVEAASGHFILNLNAGDWLLTLPLEELRQTLSEGKGGLSAGVQTDNGWDYPLWGDVRLKRYNTVPHQGCFYAREVCLRNRYDVSYRVFADFDLNQRLYKQGISFNLCDKVVAFHSLDGISVGNRHSAEIFRIVRRNFGAWTCLMSWLHFKKEGVKARWKKLQGS